MGVYIVHYQDDFFRVGVVLFRQFRSTMGEVNFGPAFGYRDFPASFQGLKHHKNIHYPVADIFVIRAGRLSWFRRERSPALADKLP
jgi:hypothetical protein